MEAGPPNTQAGQAPANPSSSNETTGNGAYEDTHYHTLLPPFPEEEENTDINSQSPWRPPTPDRVMQTQEGIDCLRTFQDLPSEAQIRVIYLHQQEGVTIEEAVATASVEHRLRLLEHPVQAREAHTAAVRLMLEQVNEGLFTQWILLTVLIQTLPQCQQETGRQILRLVSDDPRDMKGVYQARRLAAGLGNDFINRALDNINDYGSSFRRHDEDLRGLSRYDRRQPFPEPGPVDGPPDRMLSAADILKNEQALDVNTVAMGEASGAYCKVLNDWLTGICTAFADADDPVLQKLTQLYVRWNQGRLVSPEARKRRVLQYPFDKTHWNDPATTDPGAILLGAFFKCALVTRDHPSLFHLGLIADWQDWDMKKPDVAAMYASDDLRLMHSAASAHSDGMRKALYREVTALGSTVTPGLRKALLTALKSGDTMHVDILRLMNATEIMEWPLEVQCRLFTISKLHHAMARLVHLSVSTSRLAASLDKLDPFMTPPKDMPMTMFKLYARARRHANPAWHLDIFQTYHQDAVGQLKELVDSCRNIRAKNLMLVAMSKSGGKPDLQRVRDIAVTAQVSKPLIKSAEMLLWQQQDIAKLTQHIHALEKKHRAFMSQLSILEAEFIFNYQAGDDGIQPSQIREVVVQFAPSVAPHLDALGRADFGDSLRNAQYDDDTHGALDIARAFCTASLQRPLHTTVTMLKDYLDEATTDGMTFAEEDVMLVSRLLLRAIYYSYVDAPNNPATQARGLSRHCWLLGLLRAWLDWHVEATVMIKKVVRMLTGVQQQDWNGCDMWDSAQSRLVETLHDEQKDWNKVEAKLAEDEQDLVPQATKDCFFEHLHKLRLLRSATEMYLDLPDVVDLRVLPEDFREAGMTCGVHQDEGFQMLHRIVKFDMSVLDGGEATIDATGWEDAHELQLRKMQLEHLSRKRKALD